ncbi:hypothetical protein NDI38_04030 [Stenomitos frigidus AS-A4]|uniref:Uncharacterized protein n=1 Tax=Stenomitos frigidus AS-A4 TaxID=2933935 RepID=A0ABV0KEF6_9CYAN
MQGDTFDWFDLFIEGDYTLWEPAGQVRDNYAEKSKLPPINFTFLPLTYGTYTITPEGVAAPITGLFTKISPRLSAAQTALFALPRQRLDGDDPRLGKNVYVYDIELLLGDLTKTIVDASYFDYCRDVTRRSVVA